jgi:hypothetical protein
MPSSVPTPLAAALGLVPTVLEGVRRLPGQAVARAVQLPVLAVSSALTTLDVTRRGYDDLAERGERLLARLRGTSFDEVEDAIEDALQDTPVAGFYDAVEDAAEDLSEGAAAALRSVSGTASRVVGQGAAAANGAAAQAATPALAPPAARQDAGAAATAPQGAQEEVPEAEQPKDAPTPKATQPDTTRIDSAASASVQQTVERVAATAGEAVLEHDELPLPDYDHMTLGSLRGRLRSLTVEQLVQVRAYEKAKADRLPVITMLDNRIAKLTTDASASPTGNTHPDPAGKPAVQGGSPVSPATSGPKLNSPNGGDPTNPSQPRSSGAGSAQPVTSS